MQPYERLVGEIVEIELAGHLLKGKLIDVGTDLLVLFTNAEFLYVVYEHIQDLRVCSALEEEAIASPLLFPFADKTDKMSTKEMFANASGKLIKAMIFGGTTLSGYMTHIFEDYAAFQSPVYGELFISCRHIKGIILSMSDSSPLPDKLKIPKLKIDVHEIGFLSDRLNKLIGKIVVFNLGSPSFKVGKILKAEQHAVQITDLNGSAVYLNVEHIKTLHSQG